MLQNPILESNRIYQASDNVWKHMDMNLLNQMLAAIPLRGLTVDAAKLGVELVEQYHMARPCLQREVFKMRWNPTNLDGSKHTAKLTRNCS